MRQVFGALLCAGILILAQVGPAFAQSQQFPREKLNPQKNTTPLEPKVNLRPSETITAPEVESLTRRKNLVIESFSAEEGGIMTADNVVHRGPTVAALAGFEFLYDGDAHQIRQVKAINQGEHIAVVFRDHNGDDEWHFKGRYIGFPGRESEVELRTLDPVRCPGRCSIRLPNIPATHTAVLAGFDFRRTLEDANLDGMSIQLLPDRQVADVYFYDDNGFDFSGFIPYPGFDFMSAADMARNDGAGDTMVTLQLMILTRDWVFYAGRMIGGSQMMGRTIAPGQDLMPKDHSWEQVKSRGLLMGFGFAFGNGDHHIKAIKADLTETPVARFQDGDTGDPMTFFIDYAVLETTAH